MQLTKPSLLLVEGRDEVNFFSEFLKHLGLNDVQILDAVGKDNIKPNLLAVSRAPNFATLITKLGVVRDADNDYAASFRDVQGALKSAGLQVPTAPLTFTQGTPAVNVFILPALNTNGAL